MIKKILLVDSVEETLERGRGVISRDIFDVMTATTGDEALAIHRREKADLIIMDLHLPGKQGDEVCREIRLDPELGRVSIIILTTFGGEDEAARCARAGANLTLRKPIDKDELEDALAKLLGVTARKAVRVLVKVRLDGSLGGDFFIANTVDESESGLLFESDKDLQIGEGVDLSFFLPSGDGHVRLAVRSEVVRAVKGGMNAGGRYGVRFTGFTEGGAEAIRGFIAKRSGGTDGD